MISAYVAPFEAFQVWREQASFPFVLLNNSDSSGPSWHESPATLSLRSYIRPYPQSRVTRLRSYPRC